MPPTIVYSGVDDLAGTEGSIFTGKSFFITQRVPTRSRYVSDVEKNGGRVVKLETQADYLIADHMLKKHAPPDSISYRFIEDAIKDGAIPEDTSKYEVHSASPARPSAAPSGNKSFRTPFTTEDDDILEKWVRDAEKKNIAIAGNEIYKQLAAHNTRHTMHSWRDRWIKHVSRRPAPSSHTPSSPSRNGPSDPSHRSRPVSSTAKSTQREPFTPEDDEFLSEHVKAFVREGFKPKGHEMFKEIEKLNDRHPAQSWRDRWIKILAPSQDLENIRSVSLPQTEPSGRAPSARPTPSPVKTIRTLFTDEDDDYLRVNVRELLKNNPKYTTKGNGLFKEMEQGNNRHTYQSWKDRWNRKFEQSEDFNKDVDYSGPLDEPTALYTVQSTSPPPADSSKNTSPAILKENPANSSVTGTQSGPSRTKSKSPSVIPNTYKTQGIQTDLETDKAFNSQDPGSTFTDQDHQELLGVAADIQNVRVGRYHEAWACWATEKPTHTADEWRSYYERHVLPIFLEREEDVEFLKKIKGKKADRGLWKTQGQPIIFKKREINTSGEDTPREQQATVPDSIPLEPQPTTADDTHQVTNSEANRNAVQTSSPSKEQVSASERQNDRPDPAVDGHFAAEPVTHPERPLLEEVQAMNQYYGSHSTASKRKAESSQSQTHETQKRRRVSKEGSAEKALENVPGDASITKPSTSKDEDVEVIELSSGAHSKSDAEDNDLDDDLDEDGPAQQLRREMKFNKNRPKLTEANLARSQAQQDIPKGNRGADLIEDHEDAGQEDYVGFLEDVLKGQISEPTLENRARGIDLAKDDENDDQGDMIHFLSGIVKDKMPEQAAEIATTNKQIEEAETSAPDHEQTQVQTQQHDPAALQSSPFQQPSKEGLAPLDPDLSPIPAHVSQNEPPDYDDDIDLGVAEPEGGWSGSSQPFSNSNGDVALDTQGILDQETQQLDLDMPDPETQLPSADIPDSQKLTDDEVESFMSERVDAGYDPDVVFKALMATSMNRKLTDLVLETGGQAEKSGIWTTEEDVWVEAGDSRRLVQLEEKHGWGGVQRRLEFLRQLREDMEED